MRRIAFFDGFKAHLAIFDPDRGPVEFITTKAHPGQAIHVDDGATCSQLLEAVKPGGRSLTWALERKHMGRVFARAYSARLYKIREGYEGAMERMKADANQA
jgi:hypothetical protein